MPKHKRTLSSSWLYLIAAILPYGVAAILYFYYNNKIEEIGTARFVVISKEEMKLDVFDYKGEQCFEAPIACGTGYGNKSKIGDKKTPEGIFHVSSIEEASTWGHDFHDGKGRIEGAYGPYFIRLSVPGQKGIGIHGTHDPNSIGTRVTEGCVRLNNDDIRTLAKIVKPGTLVIIETSKTDIINSEKKCLQTDSIKS
jgi:lipoprotein-anchoring transpeptidase ErfK/SrfK